jgi:hypothetical protein
MPRKGIRVSRVKTLQFMPYRRRVVFYASRANAKSARETRRVTITQFVNKNGAHHRCFTARYATPRCRRQSVFRHAATTPARA